ncbi:MAG: SRPBCC domain-containing protein [Alphaproteobacteria bacterium]|nr:SRPBCC domain-containing protein [Alphaproteobacteria bacterium]
MTAETSLSEEELVLEISRQFEAPREVLFRAWTDPSWIVRWMGPGECSCPVAETDVSVGGAFKICIRGEGDHWAHGHYRELDPPGRLAFSWQWEQEDGSLGHEMLIEIDFVDQGTGTEMQFRQTKFPDNESRGQHRGGWEGSFECLAAILSE